MGKRQMGELEPIELVVAILISNLASQPLAEAGTPLLYGVIPVLTLLSCQVLIAYLTMKSIRFRRLISGKPSIIIKDGTILQAEMRKNRISIDELIVALRAQEITDMSTVKEAVLETNGSLSVILYSSEVPVTAGQMGVTAADKGVPVAVISDGRLLTDNLRILGYNEKWLSKQLSARKVKDAGDVYLMTVDETGGVYFVPKEKQK